MKPIFLLLFLLAIFSCNQPIKDRPTVNQSSPTDIVSQLKKDKTNIDTLVGRNKKEIIVLAKVNGKKDLVIVKNENWPDNVECTYNVFKYSDGKIAMILQSPSSESGDWAVYLRHYFNANGNTFAFEKEANAFVLPDDGIAIETVNDYFGQKFKNLKHEYKLVDEKSKLVDRKQYGFDYEGINIKAYPNVSECLKAYNIRL